MVNQQEAKQVATRVSIVGMAGNVALTLFKLFAGIISHSGAMISDAVHSASDVFSGIIVIVGVRLSARESDSDHPYGHERFECVAEIILAVVLFLAGGAIGIEALKSIFTGAYTELSFRNPLALIAAITSIVVKEAMFWYTKINAKRIDSPSLSAEAWHHRSDALSSVGALIGIGGAALGFPILEPIASIVICLFIFKVAFDVFKDAVDRMVDHSCDEETEAKIKACAEEIEGVEQIDLLRTRVFGNKIYVDIEIGVCQSGQRGAFVLRESLIIQCRAEVRKIYGRMLSKCRRNTDVFQEVLARLCREDFVLMRGKGFLEIPLSI